MEKIVLYFLLTALIVSQTPMVVFAQEAPPSINFSFDDEDAPPSLGTIPGTVTTPPAIPPTTTTPPQVPAATLATNNASVAMSKTGPETNFLIGLSLILGYIVTARRKKLSEEKN